MLVTGRVISGKGGIPSVELPETGTYELLVDPSERTTGTVRLRLHT